MCFDSVSSVLTVRANCAGVINPPKWTKSTSPSLTSPSASVSVARVACCSKRRFLSAFPCLPMMPSERGGRPKFLISERSGEKCGVACDPVTWRSPARLALGCMSSVRSNIDHDERRGYSMCDRGGYKCIEGNKQAQKAYRNGGNSGIEGGGSAAGSPAGCAREWKGVECVAEGKTGGGGRRKRAGDCAGSGMG